MKNPVNKVLRKARRHARTKSRVTGSAKIPRLVVSRSLLHINAQLVDDLARKTVASANDLKVKKGTRTERAKAVGTQLAEKALSAGIKTCVFDRNGYKYHGRVKALAEAAREGGLQF